MKDKRDPDRLMITHQFRIPRNGGMSYRLKYRGVYLTLVVSPRSNDADPGEWRVEARAKQHVDDIVEAQWGATRTQALSAMGRSWDANAGRLGLRVKFDWEDVARVLNEVRAL